MIQTKAIYLGYSCSDCGNEYDLNPENSALDREQAENCGCDEIKEICDCSCHDEIEYCENCCEEHEKSSGHSKDATDCSHPECNTKVEKMGEEE